MAADLVMSDEETSVIMKDFAVFEADYDNFMFDTLAQFVDENPETKSVFSWAQKELTGQQHRELPGFQKHAKQIGSFFGKCLKQLNDLVPFEKRLKQLSDLHNTKNVQSDMYAKLGGCLVSNVKNRVGEDKWTPANEAAWGKAYHIITYRMIEGF